MSAGDPTCRSCKAPLAWLTTRNGHAMPVDPSTVQAGETEYDPARHRSHFATCPYAGTFRRRGKKAKAPDPTP
jgi:predicted amidophosphoribosyltransferase